MKDVVDLLVGLAWPAVIVLAGWFFRNELKRLIDRVRSAGKGGFEFGPPQLTPRGDPASAAPLSTTEQSAVAAGAGQTGPTLSPRDYIPAIYHAFYDEMEARIRHTLATAAQRFVGTREDILVAWVAELATAQHLERASRTIFRSQLDALDTLKWQPGPLTKDVFRPFYDKATQMFPAVYANYTFDQWFGFLVGMELVTVAQDGAVTITQAGSVISRYMTDRGYIGFVNG